ncbi:MAG: IS110 family RNA-guided transposase [Planctomycetota bacterium]
MTMVYPNCAGLDVHKRFVVACRLVVDEQGNTLQELREFSTMTADLEQMAEWLSAGGCTHVAMESTGVYWQPIHNILEDRFEIFLVNAQSIKRMPGRKTDVKDAEWIATLMQHGLLQRSFIPCRAQRELRDLTRYRQSLVEERNRFANRLQKVLEGTNIKLSSVVTDIQGVSAKAMLRALLNGEEDPKVLAELARRRLRNKRAELERALVGRVTAHHRFLLGELLEQLEFLDKQVAEVEARIEEQLTQMPEYQEAIELLDTIPGVSRQLATMIVAEIGVDMSRFPSDRHLTAWAGVAPGNNETGGKRRSGKTRKGNRYLQRGLVLAARAAARTKHTYLRSLYHRLAARRGKSRAAVAVGRTVLQAAYYMLKRGEVYHELGEHYLDRIDRERTSRRLIKRLQALGFDVAVQDQTVQAGDDLQAPEPALPRAA